MCSSDLTHFDSSICCRFFGSLIQRGARLLAKGSRSGGSLTLLPILPGLPATGEPGARPAQVAAYQHLSTQQKEKLLAALERTSQQAAQRQAPEGCVSTEVSHRHQQLPHVAWPHACWLA